MHTHMRAHTHTHKVGDKSCIIINKSTTQFSVTFVYAMLKSLSKAGKRWLFIKLIACAYSFRIRYGFSSKYTSSSNISCILFCLNEYIISTIINFLPLRAWKCSVEFFSIILRVESGSFSICRYALFCFFWLLLLFSFVITAETAVQLHFTMSPVFVTLEI